MEPGKRQLVISGTWESGSTDPSDPVLS
jgi:hypothetical protein